jgi:adenylate cyclase
VTRLRDLVQLENLPRIHLPAWLERLVSLGIVSQDPRVVRRQKITNVVSYAAVANGVSRFFFNLTNDIEHYAIAQTILVVISVVALFIHRLHRFGDNVAATALVVWFIFALLFVVISFGTDSQVQVYFVLAAVILFLFGLENWRLALFWIATVFVVLLMVLQLGPVHGVVLPQGSDLRGFLSAQALVNVIIINAVIVLYALILLQRAESELERQRARAEALVNVMLPDSVSRRLRSGKETRIADRVDGVTLLFADLAGFTPVAHAESPENVVGYLDELVRTFDLMCETYDVDKIKTIGDAYLAAGGLRGRSREAAIAAGRLALEMLKVQQRRPMLGGHKLEMRVGLHCGTAIAGVIGETRISYDLWGDAVNVASRMQSQGVAGRIQVSEEYRTVVGDAFEFEDHGVIDFKGLGERRAYFLVAARDAESPKREKGGR